MSSKKTMKAIQQAVKEAGFTHEAFAKKIGVGQTMISQWVSGARNPSLSSLKKISEATGRPLSFFIENSGNTQIGNNNIVGSGNNSDTIDILKKYIGKLEAEIKDLKRGKK